LKSYKLYLVISLPDAFILVGLYSLAEIDIRSDKDIPKSIAFFFNSFALFSGMKIDTFCLSLNNIFFIRPINSITTVSICQEVSITKSTGTPLQPISRDVTASLEYTVIRDMSHTVRLRIQISNPSWEKVYIDFLIKYIVPLVPFFRSVVNVYRSVRVAVGEALKFIAGVILLILAIPFGLIVLAVLFGIPVVLFCASMGWIK